MQDKHDPFTLDLFGEPAPQPACAPKRGRPKTASALSDAERAKRYRARKKARLMKLGDEATLVRSSVIDLSALPPWKRR